MRALRHTARQWQPKWARTGIGSFAIAFAGGTIQHPARSKGISVE
jgi:hypothetical protein